MVCFFSRRRFFFLEGLEIHAAPFRAPRGARSGRGLGGAALLPGQPPASSRPRVGRAETSALALPGLERPEIPRGSFERAHLVLINYLQLELA